MRRRGWRLPRPHPPGFLSADFSIVNLQYPNLPVGNKLPTPIAELVQADQRRRYRGGGRARLHERFHHRTGSDDIELGGHAAAGISGTFAGDSNSVYATGQSADMTLSCLQPTFGAPLACDGAIDTPSAMLPPAPAPEPASLALVGSALMCLGARRRRKA